MHAAARHVPRGVPLEHVPDSKADEEHRLLIGREGHADRKGRLERRFCLNRSGRRSPVDAAPPDPVGGDAATVRPEGVAARVGLDVDGVLSRVDPAHVAPVDGALPPRDFSPHHAQARRVALTVRRQQHARAGVVERDP